MPFVFTDHKNQRVKVTVSSQELASIYYHDIFDYPLRLNELTKWSVGKKIDTRRLSASEKVANIKNSKGYLYLGGKEKIVIKRLMRKNASLYKIKIARKASELIGKIPTVKAVLVTGTLAMKNADESSDVDLMIITKKKTLWTTRLMVYGVLRLFNMPTRKPGAKDEKDKLCLNMWVDESDLSWSKRDRNVFTAHEISQVIPLVNKDKVYEKLIAENSWVKNYWPNATKSISVRRVVKKERMVHALFYSLTGLTEFVARSLQIWYMRNKITNEEVGKTRAIFHPTKLSNTIVDAFNARIGN